MNDTLLAVARFNLTGDPNGDGGDQYEKAIKLIKSLIDAGAGENVAAALPVGRHRGV